MNRNATTAVIDLHPTWTCPVCRIRFSHERDEVVALEADAHLERLHKWDATPSQRRPLGEVMVRYPAISDEEVDELLAGLIAVHGGKVDLWVENTQATFSPWPPAPANWRGDVDSVLSSHHPGLPRRWYTFTGGQWQTIT